MSDKKISALPVATAPLSGTEVLPIVQGGTTDQVSVANLTAGRAVSMLSSAVANDLAVGGATASAFEGNVRAVVGSGSGVPILTLYGGSNTYGGVYFSDGTTGNEKYRGFLEYNHSTDALAIGTAGGTKLSVSSDGNLVIATAGKGIDFSATPGAGTSELLDDYEEGNWTPSQGGGLVVVGTFSSSGTYTKTGRFVFVRGILNGSTSVAATAGGLFCGDFPFTVDIDTAQAVNNTANGASQLLVSGTNIYSVEAISGATQIVFSATFIV
jgi:hypothetical protein